MYNSAFQLADFSLSASGRRSLESPTKA